MARDIKSRAINTILYKLGFYTPARPLLEQYGTVNESEDYEQSRLAKVNADISARRFRAQTPSAEVYFKTDVLDDQKYLSDLEYKLYQLEPELEGITSIIDTLHYIEQQEKSFKSEIERELPKFEPFIDRLFLIFKKYNFLVKLDSSKVATLHLLAGTLPADVRQNFERYISPRSIQTVEDAIPVLTSLLASEIFEAFHDTKFFAQDSTIDEIAEKYQEGRLNINDAALSVFDPILNVLKIFRRFKLSGDREVIEDVVDNYLTGIITSAEAADQLYRPEIESIFNDVFDFINGFADTRGGFKYFMEQLFALLVRGVTESYQVYKYIPEKVFEKASAISDLTYSGASTGEVYEAALELEKILTEVIEGLKLMTAHVKQALSDSIEAEQRRSFGSNYTIKKFLNIASNVSTQKKKLKGTTPSDVIANYNELYRRLQFLVEKSSEGMTVEINRDLQWVLGQIQEIERKYTSYF